MRLTPADVHNVAFKKPSLGKRGYDEDEVDAFLDIVEAELTSLIEENNELRQQLAAYESGQIQPGAGAPAMVEPAAGPVPDGEGVQQYIDQVPSAAAPEHESPLFTHGDGPTAEQPVVDAGGYAGGYAAAQAAPEAAPAPVVAQAPAVAAVATAAASPADHHLQAARLLGLAQETADRLTSEAAAEAEQTRSSAKAESETMLSDARNQSEAMLSDARNESERMVSEAKNSSESMVAEATAKAEALTRDSEIKAEATDREAQRKYSEVMSQLTTQRTSLENKIDGLRTYEREYRSRLKSWISDQLSQLDESGAQAGTEQPVGAAQAAGGDEPGGE